MKKKQLYRLSHWITYFTVFHGALYFVFKYFFQVETEYGLRPHAWQSWSQALHIVASPLLVFIFGSLWVKHIQKMLRKARSKRRTGIFLIFLMILMIVSGYLAQVIYKLESKEIIAYAHIALSFLFALAYLVHHFQRNDHACKLGKDRLRN